MHKAALVGVRDSHVAGTLRISLDFEERLPPIYHLWHPVVRLEKISVHCVRHTMRGPRTSSKYGAS